MSCRGKMRALTFAVWRVQSILMNGYIFTGILFLIVLSGVGCEMPQEPESAAYSDIQGIKLSDLRAKEESPEVESLLSFTVLTYVLDPNSVGSLENIIDSVSQRDIRYDNIDAFEANGFSIGCGLHQEGARVAQKLRSIGARRISQNRMIIPPGSNEIVFEEPVVGPRAVIYSTSATGAGGATIGTGRLGWVISVQKQPDVRDVVSVTLSPAFWELGGSHLRLLEGKNPFQYRFFEVGRVHFQMEPGQFCLLGPERIVWRQDTLDRLLFTVRRRNQMRFFVIVFDGQRGIDGR